MTHSNPLIAKWEEIHGQKEEPKPDYYKGEKSYAEELEEIQFPPEWSTTSVTDVNPNSVSAITAANLPPPTFKTLTSYDVDSIKDSFLQTAEKVKNGEAQVSSMSMERDIMSGTIITFEVRCDL